MFWRFKIAYSKSTEDFVLTTNNINIIKFVAISLQQVQLLKEYFHKQETGRVALGILWKKVFSCEFGKTLITWSEEYGKEQGDT